MLPKIKMVGMTTIKILLCVFLAFFSLFSTANADSDIHFHNVTYHRCYHAHSCFVTIPGVPLIFGDVLLVRIAGIDTPEILGECEQEKKLASKARNFVNTVLNNAQEIDLHEIERGENFNLVAKIIANGKNLSELLLKNEFALPQDDPPKKQNWCKRLQKAESSSKTP
jgi:endonuclease YncB( thermonuclease family)